MTICEHILNTDCYPQPLEEQQQANLKLNAISLIYILEFFCYHLQSMSSYYTLHTFMKNIPFFRLLLLYENHFTQP